MCLQISDIELLFFTVRVVLVLLYNPDFNLILSLIYNVTEVSSLTFFMMHSVTHILPQLTHTQINLPFQDVGGNSEQYTQH